MQNGKKGGSAAFFHFSARPDAMLPIRGPGAIPEFPDLI
jgi:hypothetical protein